MEKYASVITGHLDIFTIKNEDEFAGEKREWQEILIHGDPQGLKSLAALLIKLADTKQDYNVTLPTGAREHIHLRPGHGLSTSSDRVIVGRLDAKGTGAFYTRYIPAKDTGQ